MFEWFRRRPDPPPALPEPPSAPADPPAPEDPPLAAANRRRRQALGIRKVNAEVAIGMRAAGVPVSKIAAAMDVTESDVYAAVEAIPNSKALLAGYRDRLRVLKLHRAHRLEGRLWGRLEQEVDGGTAKDVDAIARALHASEKIQASAAGDAHRVEVSGSGQPVADLKILIQNILGERGVST